MDESNFFMAYKASDPATLAHGNLETMGTYTGAAISTENVKLNLEQIQMSETPRPLKPSETYPVTSCHYLLSFRYAKAPAQAHAPTSPTTRPLNGFDPVECLGGAIGDST